MAKTAPASPDAASSEGGRSKLLLLVGVLAVLGVAAGGFLFLGGEGAAAEEPTAPVEGPVVEVASMTLNLAGPATSYAKLAFAAVLVEGADEAAVSARFPLLKDAAITEVGTIDAATLRTPAGVEELRDRLTERAADVYPDGEVLRIVLTELVVQ